MRLTPLIPPFAATVVAVSSAALGVALAGRGRVTRVLIPLSGVFLIAVAVFGLIPELAAQAGWGMTLALAAAGFGLLMALDRYAFSICPSCDHKAAAGFAIPLLGVMAFHAFADGWGLVAVQIAAPHATRALTAAVLLHKIPEGLALGAMLQVSLERTGGALAWCALAETATLAGGMAGLWLTPAEWVGYPLAVAAGTFLFLGGSAVGLRLHDGRGAHSH